MEKFENIQNPENQIKSVPPDVIESKFEKEPKPVAKAFFVRHGKSEYHEYFNDSPENVTEDLTKEGRDEIEEATQKIEDLVDPEKPVRIITSPRIRTKNSANLLKDGLKKKNIDIVPTSTIPETQTLQGVKTFGNASEIWKDLTEQYEQEGKIFDTEWREGKTRDNTKFESDIQIQERIKNTFIKGARILRKAHERGRQDLSQTIIVSHGEVIEALIAAFQIRPFHDPERKFKTGNIAVVTVYPNKVTLEYDNHKYDLNI